ncbi:hypothetical protein [Jeotgalibacillus sp. JSM ZJ347]|uniref:hypothetical protein n=1 Tax=Jeotgalibacillus sp. JSM ZJ347 TaxID=3342117 RepID=UPI0035A9267A
MKKEIRQGDAEVNIANINSNKNEITIINDPYKVMSRYRKQGKLEEATELLENMLNEKKKMHPFYPVYSYKPLMIGEDIVFKHSIEKKDEAKNLPLKIKGVLSLKDEKISSFDKFNDLLTQKYFAQEKVKVNIKHIETWIGNHLVEHPNSFERYASEKGEWYILPDKLPPPLKAKLTISYINKTETVYDYLELQVTDYASNKGNVTVTLSNARQIKSPIVFSIILNDVFNKFKTNDQVTKINLRIREGFERKVIAEKMFLDMFKYENEDSELFLIDLESKKNILSAKGIEFNDSKAIEAVEDRIQLLSELLIIEQELNVQFEIPDKMHSNDFEAIDILTALVQKKDIEYNIKNVGIKFVAVDGLMEHLDGTDNPPIVLTGQEYISINLFGVLIKNILRTSTYDNLVIKDVNKTKKKLDLFEAGDVLKIEFIPGTNNLVTTQYELMEE